MTACEREGWHLYEDPEGEPTCVPEEHGYYAHMIYAHDEDT